MNISEKMDFFSTPDSLLMVDWSKQKGYNRANADLALGL